MANSVEEVFNVEPIHIGSESFITLKFKPSVASVYPLLTARLVADFKVNEADLSALFTMDSDTAGHFVRSGPYAADAQGTVAAVTMKIPQTFTVLITKSQIWFDILCYDGAVKRLIPGKWKWPCDRPITVR